MVPGDTKGSENIVCDVISVGMLKTSLLVTDWLLYWDMEPGKNQTMFHFSPYRQHKASLSNI